MLPAGSVAIIGIVATGCAAIPTQNALFEAVVDTTEEAIVNALCMATTTTDIDGRIAYELPLTRLQEVMALWQHRYRPAPFAQDDHVDADIERPQGAVEDRMMT
jgi:hypothetical protein